MRRLCLILIPLLAMSAVVVMTACDQPYGPDAVIYDPEIVDDTPVDTSMFRPTTPQAEKLLDATWLVMGICGLIFLVVEGILIASIIIFRRRAGTNDQTPPQAYGSNPIELAWTVLPLLIVFVLFVVTVRTIDEVQADHTPPENALEVTTVGHRWWWEFQYPQYGVTTANELHIPLTRGGQPAPTWMRLESADVIHSFWVPRLAGKTDVIPNRVNTLWFEPMQEGIYLGQCAEYCGTQHANMLIRVVVEDETSFLQWVAEQKKNAVEDATVAAGRDLFLSTACINCHRVTGTVANGTYAPDLTHLMSRATLASGAIDNTPANLRQWIKSPDSIKPGCDMPDMHLTTDELDLIVAYLLSLK
jgi:cytochrome c oxidase subunit 2